MALRNEHAAITDKIQNNSRYCGLFLLRIPNRGSGQRYPLQWKLTDCMMRSYPVVQAWVVVMVLYGVFIFKRLLNIRRLASRPNLESRGPGVGLKTLTYCQNWPVGPLNS